LGFQQSYRLAIKAGRTANETTDWLAQAPSKSALQPAVVNDHRHALPERTGMLRVPEIDKLTHSKTFSVQRSM
jgi:hypothetical protein